MNEKPDTERRPRSEVEERRSLSHAAVTAFVVASSTGAGLTTGHGIAKGVGKGASKVKDALTQKDSPVILPPGTKE